MEQHFEFLRKHPVFEGFTDEEIEQALGEFDYKIQSYKNDEIIVSSGKIHKYSAFVLEGAAQIQKYNFDGVREILGRVLQRQHRLAYYRRSSYNPLRY